MDSLASIWDDPVEQHVQHDIPQTSLLRTQGPLFLEGSDDEDAPRPPPQNPAPEVDVDIDAMFADVENDDDPFNFEPLTSKLDTEALQREAEARHKRNMPSLTPHAILSSSPAKDAGHDDEGSKSKSTGGEKGKDAKKERRKPVRLDEGRLLGPTGFPKLIKDTKNFKPKGKGHEATDLNRLLQVYAYWTHEMYPKTTFRDTVERVEKLCHSKRMHVALSVWRDEAHGLVNGHRPDDDEEIIDLTEIPEIQRGPSAAEVSSPRASSPVSDGAAYASSSSRPPSRPPSSGTDMDDDDDFDIDAVIRDEEERVARERAASQASATPANGRRDLIHEDDDMAMWEALDSTRENKSHAAPSTTTVSRMEEDAMWDELDALQDGVSASAKQSAQNLDEDEDMWDVVREMESNATAAKDSSTATTGDLPAVAAAAIRSQQDDDDWDSAYA
ncbi:putative swi3-domain-containing protein [Lyophyllum shimeji]|uniref:Chromosome segregation in meiosis protein n=1 Tax=Lyophyllum shimeji TaxID=47721 RepID=A0A9P3PG85_LYOSH|nr:putative swi3-domain-containing protein [Lyophyllum shimeji]